MKKVKLFEEFTQQINEWGSSDQNQMNKYIHDELGKPKKMPSPFSIEMEDAAASAVDYYWDEWDEYRSDRDGLVMQATTYYLRAYFPKDYKKLRSMFENLDLNQESLNEGAEWLANFGYGILTLVAILYSFKVDGYELSLNGLKKMARDLKLHWKKFRMNKELFNIVISLSNDQEVLDAAKIKVVGPRGGGRPQRESDEKFQELLKSKLSKEEYDILRKFTKEGFNDKGINKGWWTKQKGYTDSEFTL